MLVAYINNINDIKENELAFQAIKSNWLMSNKILIRIEIK